MNAGSIVLNALLLISALAPSRQRRLTIERQAQVAPTDPIAALEHLRETGQVTLFKGALRMDDLRVAELTAGRTKD